MICSTNTECTNRMFPVLPPRSPLFSHGAKSTCAIFDLSSLFKEMSLPLDSEHDLFASPEADDSASTSTLAPANMPQSASSMNDDDNASEDGVTPAEVLKQMNEIWLNENASPTLLPHRDEIVQALLDCIRDMEDNFANHRDNPDFQLIINIHQLEVHRLTYIINDYLRKRLEKIDRYPEEIKLEDEARVRNRCDPDRVLLSQEEREYVNKRLDADRAMMNRVFLNRIPEVLRTLEAPGQDLSIERVFLQVNSEPVNGVAMPDMKEPDSEYLIDLQPRSRHLLPFLSVREALEENKVRLM
uniref:GINS complex subunit 4 n=1 Tax=Steinernema glaseri TaxID=37863 RepID=A0A1I8A9H5_9BILA